MRAAPSTRKGIIGGLVVTSASFIAGGALLWSSQLAGGTAPDPHFAGEVTAAMLCFVVGAGFLIGTAMLDAHTRRPPARPPWPVEEALEIQLGVWLRDAPLPRSLAGRRHRREREHQPA